MAIPSSTLPWTLDLGPNFNFAHTARDRKTLRRFAKAPPALQPQSPFFKLSGEIRNAIYVEVVRDTPVMDINANRVASPALARVCRQIEREYWNIYVELAPVHAEKMRLYDVGRVADLINRLPVTSREDPDPAKRPYAIVASVAKCHKQGGRIEWQTRAEDQNVTDPETQPWGWRVELGNPSYIPLGHPANVDLVAWRDQELSVTLVGKNRIVAGPKKRKRKEEAAKRQKA